MTQDELEQEIEKRRAQAKDRKIVAKLGLVASRLGSESKDGYRYSDTSLTLISESGVERAADGDSGWSHEEVLWKGKRVFYEGGCVIQTYNPGAWEKQLNTLYRRALKVVPKSKPEPKASDEDRKKWGL